MMFTVVFEQPENLTESIEGVNKRLIEGFSEPELAKIIRKSSTTTERYLSKLRKAGIIEFRSVPKIGGNYLIKQLLYHLQIEGYNLYILIVLLSIRSI